MYIVILVYMYMYCIKQFFVTCSYPALPCCGDGISVDEADDDVEEEEEEEEEEEGEEDCCAIDHELPLHVLPLYSMLSTEQQAKVCSDSVLATIHKLVFSLCLSV